VTRILGHAHDAGADTDGWVLVGELYSSWTPSRLEWRDRRLTGWPDALGDIDALIAKGEDIPVLPVGPFIKPIQD
jgi:hypothetical protein